MNLVINLVINRIDRKIVDSSEVVRFFHEKWLLVLIVDALLPPCYLFQASSDYVTCSGLAYKDFMSLVHADFDLLEQASACFATTVQEMEVREAFFFLLVGKF